MKQQQSAGSVPDDVLARLDEALDADAEEYPRVLNGTIASRNWRASIRRLHDQSFHVRWQDHLTQLNRVLSLDEQSRLCTPRKDLPPAWFNGDLRALQPKEWALFISLNPALPGNTVDNVEATPDAWWEFWLTHNTDHWNRGFFRRPTLVASLALGVHLSDKDESLRKFATERMIYVEVCPYASASFNLPHEVITWLSRDDIGFLIGHQIIDLLLEGEPAAVFVNGNSAGQFLEDAWHGQATWQKTSSYPSPDHAWQLWHREGALAANNDVVPVFAFPFLGKPRTHNSEAEVRDLGGRIRVSLAPNR